MFLVYIIGMYIIDIFFTRFIDSGILYINVFRINLMSLFINNVEVDKMKIFPACHRYHAGNYFH